jgi:hypothetical protein
LSNRLRYAGKQDIDLGEPDLGERFHWRRAGHILRMELDKGEVTWEEESKLFVCRRSTGTLFEVLITAAELLLGAQSALQTIMSCSCPHTLDTIDMNIGVHVHYGRALPHRPGV